MASSPNAKFEYLDSSEFDARFDELFAGLSNRFWKVECLQSYEEPDSEGVAELLAGRWTKARAAFVAQGTKLGQAHQAIAGVDFRRLRRVTLPLTPYTRLELELYRALVKAGDRVALLIGSEREFGFGRDLLVFDDRALLIHNYVDPGISVGGWFSNDTAVVEQAVIRYDERYDAGVGPEEFHARYVARELGDWLPS
jgi:hypothetical protein